MRVSCHMIALLAIIGISHALEDHALFIKRDVLDSGKRVTRQTNNADQMVQNILQWLQGVYTQNSRRIRQGTLREYLPPTNTQKPRPFQPVSHATESPPTGQEGGDETINNNFVAGYPPAGSITPQPGFPLPGQTPSHGGYPSPPPDITPPITVPDYNGYPKEPSPQPEFPTPGEKPEVPGGYPTPSTLYPTPSTGGYPTPPPTGGYPTPSTGGYPSPTTGGYPSIPTGYPTPSTGYPGPGPSTVHPTSTYIPPEVTEPITPKPFPTGPPTGYPETERPTSKPFPTYPPPTQPPITEQPETPSSTYGPTTHHPEIIPPFTSEPATSPPIHVTEGTTAGTPGEYFPGKEITTSKPVHPDENTVSPGDNESGETGDQGTGVTPAPPPTDEDLKHPPHIHAIDVECAKDMMTINIEFNRQFDGVIYSKGFYSNPDCRYVKENSGETKYSFTVSLNSCGTEFINAFDTQGQSYLENVLVLQNEPGIQEVWDTIRAVRCLWEGNLNKALSVALSVGMLNQEIVTFSGDTAMAMLDIQLGKGPFATPANGLIKIGDTMTLVVSVTGDPGFDIQVRDCKAKDSTGDNEVALTDDDGCVLKPKLFGAFQKTRNTGSTGASIIAYAFFNAFKFPDVMDLMIECNVELCKTDCEMCPDPDQKIEPGRRRRRRSALEGNATGVEGGVTMGKLVRVFVPEDLSDTQVLNIVQQPALEADRVCMSIQGFVIASATLISLLCGSSILSAYLWLTHQRQTSKQSL